MVYVEHLPFSFSQVASGIFAYICIKCVVCSASFIYSIVILTYMQPIYFNWCPASNAGARLNGDLQSHNDATVTLKSLLLD